MTIPAYRLPEYIEKGSRFGPSWRNVIQEAVSGNEFRICNWTKCRGVGDLSYGLLANDETGFQAIMAMWRAHFGSYYPFRFRDWSDCTATNSVFGTGDGSNKNFQLSMTYDPSLKLLGTPGTLLYVRNITLPEGTPTIAINGVTTTAFTIANGLVTFTTAPASGAQLTWSGTFDVPVRFDTDQLNVTMDENDIVSIGSIPIKEVIGES